MAAVTITGASGTVYTVLFDTGSVTVANTLSFPAAAVGSAVNSAVFQVDISNHQSGVSTALTLAAEISLDSGLTWQSLAGCGRNMGYDLKPVATGDFATNWMWLEARHMPAAGTTTRMVRGTVTITGPALVTQARLLTS